MTSEDQPPPDWARRLIHIWKSAGGTFETGYGNAIQNSDFQALTEYSTELLRQCANEAPNFRQWRECARSKQTQAEKARHREAERRKWADIERSFEDAYLSSRAIFDQVRDERGLREEDFHRKEATFVASWAKRRSLPLDQQQATAAGAVEQNVLVTARAGSGKTRIIEARTAFLHQHCQVDPDEILVLAFNRKAAEELANRIKDHFQSEQPHIMTFDALAHALTQSSENRLYDNRDNNELEQSRFIQEIVDDFIQSSDYSNLIRSLMLEYFKSDWHQIIKEGRFLKPDLQIEYRESLPNYSLDLRPKKSFGEKQIANFLIRHGVEFDYEKHWKWWRGVSYKPDFTISTPQGQRRPLVIEYFGMQGDPDYDKQTAEKERFWSSETPAQFLALSPTDIIDQDSLTQILTDQLAQAGIEVTPISDEELWEKYKSRHIDHFSRLLADCVTLCRNANWSSSELNDRILSRNTSSQAETKFLDLLPPLLDKYERELANQNRLDFPGVFWRAINAVESGETRFVRRAGQEVGDLSQIRFILVDEFQDLSKRFAELLMQIRRVNEAVCLFCVGDDWQAINGFAGSDLTYFQEFQSLFGTCRKIELTTNYRSYKNLVAFGNAVMAQRGSPAQASQTQEGTIHWGSWDDFSPSDFEREEFGTQQSSQFFSLLTRSLTELLKTCKTVAVLFHFNYPPHSLPKFPATGLERYQERIRDLLPERHRSNVEFSTVHKYKGKEADGIILCHDSPNIFPFIHQLWIFKQIFGLDLERLVNEERRLYYVAVSRAKKNLILLRQKQHPSQFHPNEAPGVTQLTPRDLPECEGVLRTDKIQLVVANGTSGATIEIKDQLRANGYRYDSYSNSWSKLLTPTEAQRRSWRSEGWYHSRCTEEQNGKVITVMYRSPTT